VGGGWTNANPWVGRRIERARNVGRPRGRHSNPTLLPAWSINVEVATSRAATRR
jgi:hypothetical protein